MRINKTLAAHIKLVLILVKVSMRRGACVQYKGQLPFKAVQAMRPIAMWQQASGVWIFD